MRKRGRKKGGGGKKEEKRYAKLRFGVQNGKREAKKYDFFFIDVGMLFKLSFQDLLNYIHP